MESVLSQDKSLKKEGTNPSRGKSKKRWWLLLLNVIMWLFVMFPLIYAFLMAIKPASELYNPDSILIPQEITLTNFVDVFSMAPIATYIRNSLIVSLAITAFQIVTSLLAGFAFQFIDFKGKKIIYALILSTMMIPGEAVIISQFLMVSGWGWNDTLIVLIVLYMVSAFNIFLCCQALENFPYEIYEAAKIDGCSDIRFLFTIMMPLLKPTIGAMAVQSFLSGWNMYMWPLLVTNNDQARTVQVGIGMLNSVDSQSMVLMVAGVVICMVPSLAIFIFGQRNMVKGLTQGAVKG
ncbi:carbohydrate ABC transporter permease [Aerococcus sanguinicola]|uniref:Carbohydrate ABC transporter permease n=1 Tax=Aerococcus sanguinicola TaxID=119206 RepID=A0A5N1GSQ5_9LACT|nr:carbohydrate ABC transporter permease [Aerococcus sanguinicola]KAA9301700.1 carbohydrate ABC transporter permease [Aerococcus sanguinicola]